MMEENNNVTVQCKVRMSPSNIEIYSDPVDMNIYLNNPVMIYEILETGCTNLTRLRSFGSKKDELNSSRAQVFNPMTKALAPPSSPKRGGKEATLKKKKIVLKVQDIIVCEIYRRRLKITSISNGIFELIVEGMKRELVLSYLSNLLPNERMTVPLNESKSIPYRRTNSEISMEDTVTTAGTEFDMEKFTQHKMKKFLKEEEPHRHYQMENFFTRISEAFQNCISCSNCGSQSTPEKVLASDETVVSNSLSNCGLIPKKNINGCFSYEDESLSFISSRSSKHNKNSAKKPMHMDVV